MWLATGGLVAVLFVAAVIYVTTLPRRTQIRMLQGKTVALGLACDDVQAALFEKDFTAGLADIAKLFADRGVRLIELTRVQANWLHRPEDRRGAYFLESSDPFPDAAVYVILAGEVSGTGFEVYSANLKPIILAASELPYPIVRQHLDRYFRSQLLISLTLLMSRMPEAFTGQYWEPSATSSAKQIFTLPPGLK